MRSAGRFQTLISSWDEQVARPQKLLILTALVLAGTVLAGFLFIQAPWQQKRRLFLEDLQQEQERSQLLSSIHLQSKQLQRQKERLLLEGGTLVLISEVTRLAAQSKIQIDSVTPQPDMALGPFTQSQILVEARSRLPQLLQFLHEVEQHEPLMKVDRLEIGEAPASSRTGPLQGPSQEEGTVSSAVPEEQKTALRVSAFTRRGNSP